MKSEKNERHDRDLVREFDATLEVRVENGIVQLVEYEDGQLCGVIDLPRRLALGLAGALLSACAEVEAEDALASFQEKAPAIN